MDSVEVGLPKNYLLSNIPINIRITKKLKSIMLTLACSTIKLLVIASKKRHLKLFAAKRHDPLNVVYCSFFLTYLYYFNMFFKMNFIFIFINIFNLWGYYLWPIILHIIFIAINSSLSFLQRLMSLNYFFL